MFNETQINSEHVNFLIHFVSVNPGDKKEKQFRDFKR